MPISRRHEILDWAEANDSIIIEDDYDSEFRYKGKPNPALQGYDAEDKVIYLGTFSKSIAPRSCKIHNHHHKKQCIYRGNCLVNFPSLTPPAPQVGSNKYHLLFIFAAFHE